MSEMQYLTPKTSIKELNQKERRSSSAQAVAEICSSSGPGAAAR